MMFEAQAQWLLAQSQAFIANAISTPVQLLATLAAIAGVGLVIAGAFVRTMLPLRWLAVGSNIGLVVYGALHP